MKAKIYAIVLSVVLILTNFGASSYALGNSEAMGAAGESSVRSIVITFTKGQADAYIKSIEQANNEYIESLENEILLSQNRVEIKMLRAMKKQLEQVNVADYFVQKGADYVELRLDCGVLEQICKKTLPGYSMNEVQENDKLTVKKAQMDVRQMFS